MNEFDITKGKVIKCLAGVSWGANEKISVEEIEVHPPQKGEIRIKVLYCGICHSDLYGLNGDFPGAAYPSIMGHEAAGLVESVGEGITNLQAGDKVILCFNSDCGKCTFCQKPDTNFCKEYDIQMSVWPDGSSRYICKGQKVHNFCKLSTFSQYVVVYEHNVVKVDGNAPLEKVCLLSCGFPCGFGAAINVGKVKPNSTCGIWGLGTVGLAAAAGCRAMGASKIIGVDISPNKEQIAKKFGVTDFVNPKDHQRPVAEIIKEMTGGDGCDVTLECIANPVTVKDAFDSCCNAGGRVVVVGVAPSIKDLSISTNELLSGKILTGCLFGGYKAKESIPKLLQSYRDNELPLEDFISGYMKLQDINKAVDLLKQAKTLRTIIDMF